MKKLGYIYKILSPTFRIYVGKTFNIQKRKSRYSCLECKHQNLIYASLKKYGFKNHKFKVIQICTSTNINKREIYWIKKLNSFHLENEKGMNLTRGGEGTVGHIHSNESKRIMRERKLGRRKYNPVNQFLLDGTFLKKWHSIRVGEDFYGKGKSSCIKLNVLGGRRTAYGFIWSYRKTVNPYYPNQERVKKYRKKVYQFDKRKKLIGQFDSASIASSSLGIECKNIQCCCVGRNNRKKAGGYYWNYNKKIK